MSERCVALLGRRDEPTDAVEEYCCYLKAALVVHGFSLELVRVPWAERGWDVALHELRGRLTEWRGLWVFMEYTALAWSRHGFPFRVPSLLRELRRSGARCAIVFHDTAPYAGRRAVDRIRQVLQLHTMRGAVRRAELVVLTVPADKLAWLPERHDHAVFIPVGANLPSPQTAWTQVKPQPPEPLTVAAFSLSEGAVGQDEVKTIVEAVRFSTERIGRLRLVLLGRNSDRAEKLIRDGLRDLPVEIVVHGLLSAQEIVHVLGRSDVLIFARGPLSTRRGSAIAGIACGLPVVGCEGWETAPPITKAGAVLLPAGSRKEFGPALHEVLTDAAFRTSLAARSRRAYEDQFSWSVIASQYAAAMRTSDPHIPPRTPSVT